jgi:thiol:disulfide interchange protein DsbD
MFTLCVGAGNIVAADYLQPEKAFRFAASMIDPNTIKVTYGIADGYYMYRERFMFQAENAVIGKVAYPNGITKFDETFKKNVETYRGMLTIIVPVKTNSAFTLKVVSQGCADLGLCYAPIESHVTLSPRDTGLSALHQLERQSNLVSSVDPSLSIQSVGNSISSDASETQAPSNNIYQKSQTNRLEAALQSGNLLVIIPLFILLGLGLSFTPCVLPMIPILSSIIVGDATRGQGQSFLLSLTYSLGMALVYTAMGIAAGLIGEGLASYLQSPIVLIGFALLLVALALSMLGLYTLQMPQILQTKLTGLSQKQSAGKFLGVLVMGALSAVIVGPCIAAPLAGALVYISQTRNVVIGGSALFALAVGMSVPLLLIGLSAGTLLPRAGQWMSQVKQFFGVLMLALAWWMVAPIITPRIQMLGWALLIIGYGIFLFLDKKSHWVFKALATFLIALGLAEFVGAVTGGRDPLRPVSHLYRKNLPTLQFARIKSVSQLDDILSKTQGKTLMLDFYADWCVACKEMESGPFTEPAVHQRLANTILLQADVTANDGDDRAMLKRFDLFGPPGIILFNREGREITASRIIGYQSTKQFLKSLKALGPG